MSRGVLVGPCRRAPVRLDLQPRPEVWRGGDQPNLRVVGRIEADEPEHHFDVLVVEEA